MKYIIFDDNKIDDFYPLTFTRPVGDLKTGILKLRQRLFSYFNMESYNLVISDNLEKLYRKRHPDFFVNDIINGEAIFINSRIIISDELVKKIDQCPLNSSLISNGNIVAAKLNLENKKFTSETLIDFLQELDSQEIDANFWTHIWDLISENSKMIRQDFQDFFYDKDNFFETEMGVTVLNPYNIWIGEGVTMKPGVVIDATEGPVIIDENATILSNAVIVGPTYIGKSTTIKIGAKIYEGSSIGKICKVGGEVEDSIITSFSNKQHDGFLGHSYLGEWVNIGADTNNSDLKNNYKNVKMYHYPSKKKIDSETKFLGCIIGDHTKIGINCSINTGSVIGIGCNLYGRNLLSDFIPDFSWGEAGNLTSYHLEKFVETAALVKKRRNLYFDSEEKELYNKLYEKFLNYNNDKGNN